MQTKNNFIQIILLLFIQCFSLIVVIINSIALGKDTGLIITAESGPQDYILLVMALASFIIVSIFLYIHFSKIFPSVELSKKFSSTKIAFSILVITLWTSATSIILSNFNSLSICHNRILPKITTFNSNSCNLVNAIIITAFITIGFWSLLLLIAIYTLAEQCKISFVRESSPIQPYENVKIQISANSNNCSIEQPEYDTVTITTTHQKEEETVPPLPTILTTKLKDWNFDFQPMDIDLSMLPKRK